MNQNTNPQDINAKAQTETKLSLRTGLKAGRMGDIMPDRLLAGDLSEHPSQAVMARYQPPQADYMLP